MHCDELNCNCKSNCHRFEPVCERRDAVRATFGFPHQGRECALVKSMSQNWSWPENEEGFRLLQRIIGEMKIYIYDPQY